MVGRNEERQVKQIKGDRVHMCRSKDEEPSSLLPHIFFADLSPRLCLYMNLTI